ncbi:hypothetical protein HYT04_01035 [Candidatus Kaiserbacteria bacterium]|nr:hypothetical protein [Candidatus Kaiserbacteria bacterium]
MATNNAIGGKITIHAGTHYGGSAQRDCDYYRNNGCDTLINRAKKFLDQKNTSARTNKREPARMTVHVENIQWIAKRKIKKSRAIYCPRLADLAKKMVTGRKSAFKQLYATLVGSLRDPRFPPIVQFSVIATGVDPRHRREMGTFIKAMINNEEFVLPSSFLRDCSDAFLKNLPI